MTATRRSKFLHEEKMVDEEEGSGKRRKRRNMKMGRKGNIMKVKKGE
jgi:hypothetical protein